MRRASTFRRLPILAPAAFRHSHAAATAGVQVVEPLGSIRAAAEDFVRRQQPDVSRVHLRSDELDPRLRLAECASPLTASLVAGAELHARTAVKVSCPAPAWTVFVPVTLESDVPVLVLRQSAARGERLSVAQVTAETRRVSGPAAAYVTDTAALARHTLTRSLPAGAVLTADALLPDYIIRQGQAVTLIAATSGIEVRAAGKALEDGREGARVRVQNLASLRVVQGVVDANGTIEVTP
jgi:flagella basal body P-ring formation protein FlgA